MKPRHIPILIVFAIGSILAGCSSGHSDGPSRARISQQIARQFNQEFGANFVQVEGIRESQGRPVGKERYIALVHFKIKFTRSLADIRKQNGDGQAEELHVLFDDFRAGDTKPMTDEVLFQKTDKGWFLINSKQRK